MPLADDIRAKVNALQEVPLAFNNSVANYQPKLFAQLTKLLDSLELDETGNIAKTARNIARIDQIIDGLKKTLTTGEYKNIVRSFADEIDAQKGRTVQYFTSAIGSDPPITSFAATMYAKKRAEAINSVISNSALDGLLANDLRATLSDAVAGNSRYSNTLESLQTLINGNDEIEGLLQRRGRQIVSDTFATTDRAFTDIVAQDLELEWYLYSGGEMDTTRCFCEIRNGRYYHRSEIQSWGNLENIGACRTKNGWAGRMPDTTADTIFINAGGFYCQHSFLPVSIFAVPKEDVERAITGGFFEPNKQEREFFNL
jgi:hypothetical protein